jgi:hypothetical protein
LSWLLRWSTPQRAAFEDAARAVVAALPYLGPGVVYRALKPLQRQFFQPPDDTRIGQTRGSGIRRPSKLIAAEPLGEDNPRCGERARRSFGAV